jgi:hypothetical protein
VRKGDVVIVSLEYEHFSREQAEHPLLSLLEYRPQNIQYFSWHHLPVVLDFSLDYFSYFLKRNLNIWRGRHTEKPAYRNQCVNAYGDFVCHWTISDREKINPYLTFSYFPRGHLEEVMTQLNAFADHCQARGAIPFYSFPPMTQSGYRRARPMLEELHQTLKRELRMSLLHGPREMSFANEFFFDTKYHLRRAGITQRMTRLIHFLGEKQAIVQRLTALKKN